MLNKNNTCKQNFDDTVTDLEFALKRARLYREVEDRSRGLNRISPEKKILIQQEIYILKIQIKEMDQDKKEISY